MFAFNSSFFLTKMVFILIKSNLSISFFLNAFWWIVKHIFASSNFFLCWLHFQGQFGFCFIDEAKLIQSPFYSHSYPVNSVDPVNFSYCFRIVRFCPKFKCDCFWNIFYWCVCVCAHVYSLHHAVLTTVSLYNFVLQDFSGIFLS